jgi:hypothetical protein
VKVYVAKLRAGLESEGEDITSLCVVASAPCASDLSPAG